MKTSTRIIGVLAVAFASFFANIAHGQSVLNPADPIVNYNEYQLYHGGQIFRDSVDSGAFDGYILCMQTGGFWGTQQYGYLLDIINYMIVNNKLDPFHVVTNGLSGGAQGTWEMMLNYPT